MITLKAFRASTTMESGKRSMRRNVAPTQRARPWFVQTARVLLVLFAVAADAVARVSETEIAEAIRENLESNLFTLSPVVQKHYAVRLYRLTGDKKYLSPIIADLMITANRLRHDIDRLDDEAYIARRNQRILDRFHGKTKKSRRRQAVLAAWKNMAFHKRLLRRLSKVRQYGLLDTVYFEKTDKAVQFLKQVDFASFILDEAVVRVYAAQLINYVYFLYDLDIVDLRDQYTAVFRAVFPDETDAGLSRADFAAKIYGLTHFVIAASRYYQYGIKKGNFEWIYRYFETHIDRILKETKPDIIAEVALCFLLAGDRDNRVVKKIKEAIATEFNTEHDMILSTAGCADLQTGEHRNVLAIMVFSWPDRLYSGPALQQFKRYRALLPLH